MNLMHSENAGRDRLTARAQLTCGELVLVEYIDSRCDGGWHQLRGQTGVGSFFMENIIAFLALDRFITSTVYPFCVCYKSTTPP